MKTKNIIRIKSTQYVIVGALLYLTAFNLPTESTSIEALADSTNSATTESKIETSRKGDESAAPAPNVDSLSTAAQEPTLQTSGDSVVFFLSDRDNNPNHFDIYVMDLDTKEIRRITTSEIPKHNLVVSPDGHWGAFVTGDFDKELIYTVDLTQTNPEPVLVTDGMPNSHFPIWSPDSQRLAFEHGHALCCSTPRFFPSGEDLQRNCL